MPDPPGAPPLTSDVKDVSEPHLRAPGKSAYGGPAAPKGECVVFASNWGDCANSSEDD